MKKWTKTELKTAKLIIRMDYKMGNLKCSTKDLILRPYKMDKVDYTLLLQLFEEYGQTR